MTLLPALRDVASTEIIDFKPLELSKFNLPEIDPWPVDHSVFCLEFSQTLDR